MAQSLAQKLATIRSKVPKADPLGSLKNVMETGTDNVDHINMNGRSDSQLGRFLTMSSRLELRHSIFSNFSCVDSFRYWLLSESRDDAARTLQGNALYEFGRSMRQRPVTNLRAIVMDANYQRIMQHKPLLDSLRKSDLPFECYRVDAKTGLRIRPTFAKWFIWGMEEIRRAVKEDREPNFTPLLDKRGSGIYDFVVTGLKVDGNGKKVEEEEKAAESAPHKRGETPVAANLDEAAFYKTPEEVPAESTVNG